MIMFCHNFIKQQLKSQLNKKKQKKRIPEKLLPSAAGKQYIVQHYKNTKNKLKNNRIIKYLIEILQIKHEQK